MVILSLVRNLWVPRRPSAAATRTLRATVPGGGCLLMVLSFLYVAFVRVVQLVRLSCRAQDDLAIEIVMLRHEVAVLRRQVDRPGLRPADRALLAGLSRLLSRARQRGFFVQPATL